MNETLFYLSTVLSHLIEHKYFIFAHIFDNNKYTYTQPHSTYIIHNTHTYYVAYTLQCNALVTNYIS